MGKKFFIADLHIGHANAIKFDKRPFENVEEMDNEIRRRWNSVVGEDDDVYVLGDFHWGTAQEAMEYANTLSGRIHIIFGNHDPNGFPRKNGKIVSQDYFKILRFEGRKVHLSHYPIPWWGGHRQESQVFLYGHVHNTPEYQTVLEVERLMKERHESRGRSYNVGACMPWIDYTPRTLEEIESNFT